MEGKGSIPTTVLPIALRAAGLAPSNEELDKIVAGLDKGGKVTFEAFSAALKQNAALAQGSQDVAMAAFAVYDKTDKGVVSAPEWRHVMTSIGDKLNDEEADYMIADCQPDKDGMIVYKRFVEKIK